MTGMEGAFAGALMWGPVLLAAGCAYGGVLVLGRRGGRVVRRRARGLGEYVSPATQPERGRVRLINRVRDRVRDRPLREGAAALGALAFGAGVLGGAVGWLVGAAGAYGVWRWMRGRAERGGQHAELAEAGAARAQMPLVADLLAACLAAGSSPERAAEAVGHALGGPLGDRMVRAATELRLGGEPAVVWQRFGALPGSAGLARCLERTGTSGVPAVRSVTRLAAELRADRARDGAARARRAAVLVTGPLGLCFLPAFLAVGVAPVVIGLAESLL